MNAPSPERQRHYRACHLCEAICGLVIDTEGDEIVAIRGDKDDPLSRGHICPKAVALKDLHEDPDRLRGPVKKVIDEDGTARFEPISWEEALDTTARALVETRDKHGVNAIGIYMGNPSVHNYGMMTHQSHLFRRFRTDNRFSATSVDQLPHHLASMWLFGHKLLFPIPDIDRSDYFLMLGANPLASNGSIWTVPDVRKRIKALKARGAKLVVIDPRRTETAQLASEHHFVTPGSDALLLAALLHTLFDEGLADPGHLAAYTDGLDVIEQAVAAGFVGFAQGDVHIAGEKWEIQCAEAVVLGGEHQLAQIDAFPDLDDFVDEFGHGEGRFQSWPTVVELIDGFARPLPYQIQKREFKGTDMFGNTVR